MALADNMPRDAIGDLKRQIRDLERAVREMRAERRLDSATISAEPGKGIRVADFNGTDFANPGTVGNYFGGDGMVINQAYFRPGSVSNDALTNPVIPDTASVRATNFAVSGGAFALLGTATKDVPAGFSQLLVTASGWLFARNPNTTGGVDGTGTDAMYCFVRVTGSDGNSDSTAYGQGISGFGGFTTATSGVSALKTGLTGSVTLQIWGGTSVQSFATNAQNSATLSATLLWLR